MMEVWLASAVVGMATNVYVKQGKRLGQIWGESRKASAKQKAQARAGEAEKGTSWWVGLDRTVLGEESVRRFGKPEEREGER